LLKTQRGDASEKAACPNERMPPLRGDLLRSRKGTRTSPKGTPSPKGSVLVADDIVRVERRATSRGSAVLCSAMRSGEKDARGVGDDGAFGPDR